MKRLLYKVVKRIPLIKYLFEDYFRFKRNSCFPAGHFYSPIVLIDEVRLDENIIWQHENENTLAGIELNTKDQLDLVDSFSTYYPEMPFKDNPTEGWRFYFSNNYFGHSDAIILYSLIRHVKPERIIEIGSGFSSALMLDMSDHFSKLSLTFIEPFPDRLNSLLRDEDFVKVNIIKEKIQHVDLNVVDELKSNDILFVDSSHISKTGSDLNHILFEILPRLKSGVWIHFHDIFYPFEYPRSWVYKGRNWNEAYLLRAFLSANREYKIEFFTSFLLKHFPSRLEGMPAMFHNPGASLWIRKL